MGFFNLIGLLALAGVPLIIILHMLKRKQKDVRIPSAFLWERAADTSVQSKPWQKLKKSLPLILQLVAALSLGLAAARPYISAFGRAYNYVIVLDTSLSMSANDMGETRLEYAKKRASKLVDSASAMSKITVIAADESPYVIFGPDSDKTAAKTAIGNVKQSYGGIDTDSLDGLVESERAQTDAGVYLFTDSENSFNDIDAGIFYAGKQTENSAVTFASASDGNVLANVRNYSDEEVLKTVTLFDGNMAVAVNEITVPPDSERSVVFKDIYNDSAELTVSISPEDILPMDDTYYLTVNNSEPSKILLVSEGNTFLENALKLSGNTEIYKMTAETMETMDIFGYDLYVFDGALPDIIPDDGSILILNPPDDSTYINVSGTRELNTVANGATELSTDGDIDFIISRAKNVEKPSWAVAESYADGIPLIMRGENNGQKTCIFTFDIHDSDLPLKKDFPVMIYRLCEWFMPNAGAENKNTFCGESLNTDYPVSAEKITVINPEGRESVIAPPFPVGDYTKTDEAGFYTVVSDNNDGSQDVSVMAVNVKTNGESELSAMFGNDVEGNMGTASKGGAALMNILIIVAVVALIMEWWVKYHGIKR